MHACHLHVGVSGHLGVLNLWEQVNVRTHVTSGITGERSHICFYATPMCGVSPYPCFLHVSGDKSTYAFMSPSCVGYHGIYVSSRCGETNQHMHLCHLHVWGMTASMFPLCLGRQVIIFIYAMSMRGVGSDACVFVSCVGRQANI